MRIDVSVEDLRLLPAMLRSDVPDLVIVPGERMDPGDWRRTADRIHAAGKQAGFALPYILREESGRDLLLRRDELLGAGFDSLLIRSLDEAGLCRELGFSGERIFDSGMYTWNHRAADAMRSLGADVLTLPVECRREELRSLTAGDSELIAYGRLPVMISAQCSQKTRGQCRRQTVRNASERNNTAEFRGLTDRKRAVFREASWCRYCYSVIYNSVPLWLLDLIPEGMPRLRFLFTDESEEEAAAVLNAWRTGETAPPDGFTRGHFMRGVE